MHSQEENIVKEVTAEKPVCIAETRHMVVRGPADMRAETRHRRVRGPPLSIDAGVDEKANPVHDVAGATELAEVS